MKKSITERQREELDPQRPSHLFLLRVWIQRENDSRTTEELAGKVQDPVSGQVQYFRRPTELVRILRQEISKKEHGGPIEAADQRKPDEPAPEART